MKVRQYKLIPLSCIFLMIVFGCTSVNAALYHFSQRGFEDGGYVTGSFSGEDLSGGMDENGIDIPDGKIEYCFSRGCGQPVYDDLHSFNIHFSGNSLFSSSNQLPDLVLDYLKYNLNTNFLSLSFGTETTTGDFSQGSLGYRAGFEFLKSEGELLIVKPPNEGIGTTYHRFSTTEPLVVTQVPLPSAFLLFASAIVMIFRRFKAIKS